MGGGKGDSLPSYGGDTAVQYTEPEVVGGHSLLHEHSFMRLWCVLSMALMHKVWTYVW